MASAVASRRVPLLSLMEKLLSAPSAPGVRLLRPAAPASGTRLYNSSTPFRRLEDDHSDDGISRDCGAVNNSRGAHHFAVPCFYPAVLLHPFGPLKSSSPLSNQAGNGSATGRAAPPRGADWYAKEDGEALYLLVELPGLGKEHVKVWTEKNELVIEGEVEKGSEEDTAGRTYSGRMGFLPEAFKLDEIKAEMKNGVLKVVVPKVKEEPKDKLHVTVD